jgi:hypothetical protein
MMRAPPNASFGWPVLSNVKTLTPRFKPERQQQCLTCFVQCSHQRTKPKQDPQTNTHQSARGVQHLLYGVLH